MKKILTVALLELRQYSASPIIYVVGAVFLTVCGYLFSDSLAGFSLISLRAVNLDKMLAGQDISANSMVFTPLFSYMGFFLMLLLPLMTMRLLAEERRSGTLELLFSYPVTNAQLILGKMAACALVLLLLLLATLLYPLLTGAYGLVKPGPILAGYLGLFLQGVAIISLGLFASSLTENQIIAAILSYGGVVIFGSIRFSVAYLPKFWAKLVDYLAMSTHSGAFILGVIDTRDVVYFFIFTVFFFWLTLQSLEARQMKR